LKQAREASRRNLHPLTKYHLEEAMSASESRLKASANRGIQKAFFSKTEDSNWNPRTQIPPSRNPQGGNTQSSFQSGASKSNQIYEDTLSEHNSGDPSQYSSYQRSRSTSPHQQARPVPQHQLRDMKDNLRNRIHHLEEVVQPSRQSAPTGYGPGVKTERPFGAHYTIPRHTTTPGQHDSCTSGHLAPDNIPLIQNQLDDLVTQTQVLQEHLESLLGQQREPQISSTPISQNRPSVHFSDTINTFGYHTPNENPHREQAQHQASTDPSRNTSLGGPQNSAMFGDSPGESPTFRGTSSYRNVSNDLLETERPWNMPRESDRFDRGFRSTPTNRAQYCRNDRLPHSKPGGINLFLKFTGQDKKFSGQHSGALEFLKRLRKRAEATHLTPDEVFTVFGERLEGEAVTWFEQTFKEEGRIKTQTDVEELYRLFIRRYEGSSLPAAAMAKITSRYHQAGRSYTAYYDDILQYCEQAGIPLDEGIIVHYLERGLTPKDIFRLRDKFGTPSLHQIKQQFEHWDSGNQLIKTIHPHPQSVQSTSSRTLNNQRIVEDPQQTIYKPSPRGGNFRRIPSSTEQFRTGLGNNPQISTEDRLARSLAQLLRRSQTSETNTQQAQTRNNFPQGSTERQTGVVNFINQDESMDLMEDEYNPPEDESLADQTTVGEYEWAENSIAEVLAALQYHKDKPGYPAVGSTNPTHPNYQQSQHLHPPGGKVPSQRASAGPNKIQQKNPTNTNVQQKLSENPLMEKMSSLTDALNEIKDALKIVNVKQSNQKSPISGTTPYSCWTCGNPNHFRSECPIFLRLFQTLNPPNVEPGICQSNKTETNPLPAGNGISPGQ
jgi:hypothetical protein